MYTSMHNRLAGTNLKNNNKTFTNRQVRQKMFNK